ncbi:MAG TPA: CHASE3 domain-containing protein [Actinomycetota bacterium]|nr:CHASE3 domain-containing protein [Actinomycetota bacterium]
MLIASGLLALLIGAAFAVLLSSVADLRASERRARRSEEVLVVANRLERLVVDLEAAQLGFVITDQERFLEPWQDARTALPGEGDTLERLVADSPAQQEQARRIVEATRSYLRDYSVPLVTAARRDPAAARTVAATDEGRRRMDALRAEFDRFVASERGLAAARQRRSDAATRRAIVAAAAGLGGSILLIVLFAGYLTRAIVQPVRRAAAMAGRLAGGDLGARMPERGVGEIGMLEASFNTMAGSLELSREELAASRTRVVAAADQARRRIERDLHDGTQQRLVSLVLDLRAAQAAVPPELPELRAQLARVADGLTGALEDLRELSRGIHPAILSEGGLAPALKALARRSAVPVELEVEVPARLAEPVEVAAYYVVSEALANTAKHANASVIHVRVQAGDDRLQLSVRDDGVGGATPGRGSGLVGLTDRVQALGGTITIHSPAGQGTRLQIDLPVQGRPSS